MSACEADLEGRMCSSAGGDPQRFPVATMDVEVTVADKADNEL